MTQRINYGCGGEIEKIRQLRSHVIIHSYIYYELNENIWSDHHFDIKAKEAKSQNGVQIGWFDDVRFEGDTGHHIWASLCKEDKHWVCDKALKLLRSRVGVKED